MPKNDAGANPSPKEGKPRRSRSQDTARDSDPNYFPDDLELSDIREALAALPTTNAKIEAVAQAIALTTRQTLEHEHARIQLNRDFFLELHAAIEQLQISLGPLRDNLAVLANPQHSITTSELHRIRHSSILPRNDLLTTFDRLHDAFIEQVAPLAALQHNLAVYLSKSAPLLDVLEKSRDLSQLRDALDTLSQSRAAFMETIDDLERQLGAFPQFCSHVQNIAGYISDTVAIQYGQAPSESFGRSMAHAYHHNLQHIPDKQDIPLYQGNPFLSSYLHDIAIALEATHRYAETPPKFLQAPQFAEFIKYLRACADPRVYAALRSERPFSIASSNLSELHEALHQVYLSLKASEVLEIDRDEEFNIKTAYFNSIRTASQILSGDQQPLAIFGDFDPDSAVNFLANMPSTAHSEPGTSTPTISHRHRIQLELFRLIDQTLHSLMRGEAGNPELETFLKDSTPLIKEIAHKGDHGAALRREIQRGNLSFTVIGGEGSPLSLDRVATTPTTYDDLIGESWEAAKQTLVDLRQRALLRNIFTHMQTRPQANPSLLISGPRGCGKSLFVDAVMADPKLLAVRMATHDIISPYAGQSERRLTELLELCALKTLEHGKPTVLLWDNFSTLYPPNQSRQVRLQRLLEDVLHGSPRYDGVGIIALTDSLKHLPPSLRNSFSKQITIQPLTGEDRRQTMMQFLAGLPLASHFEKSVSWEDFDEKSTDATGAILRRIADSVFLSLLESIAEDYGNSALTAIDSLTGEHLRKAPLTPELRLEIFRQAAPHSEVTPTAFRNAYRKVLDDKQVQELLRENSRFYDDIEGVSDDYLDNEDRE